MSNPGFNTAIWTDLRQKWVKLDAEGHHVKVDFNVLKDPQDSKKDLAMDVAQNIDGEWIVQTVQQHPGEARSILGIEGVELSQLIEVAEHVINSVIEPILGQESNNTELHLLMKRFGPDTSEISCHLISESGERISIRTNYQQYYLLNEILEQTSNIKQEQYSELQVHRNKGKSKLSFCFIPA